MRDWVAVLAVTLALFAGAWLPIFERIGSVSADLLLLLRHEVFGQRHPPATSQAVVIAIDELTYRTPPFSDTPKVLWTPRLAAVVDAVLAGGAKVVGFDVIFPTTVESYLPGFERPFLISLRRAGREGKLVLGKVQHQHKPISPFPAQSMMVGNERNIRMLNMNTDVDDVIRRLPLFFTALHRDGKRRDSSMALELAARAAGVEPVLQADDTVLLGNYAIPGTLQTGMRINFQGDNDIPTYSLADLNACVEAGESDYFAHHFKDKVVILGEVLDLEDRKLTGKRFMTGLEGGAPVTPCQIAPPAPTARSLVRRETIPGVFIHAAAVNDLLRGDALRDVTPLTHALMLALAAFLTAVATVWLTPLFGIAAVAAMGGLWTVASVLGVQNGLVLPLLPVTAAILISYGVMLGYRYMVADQQKARIRRLFSLYLTPALVNRMVDSDKLPELGGEMRRVTVWFSDVASFTALSEGLSPHELVEIMNKYFSVITDIIEAHGGFVDKYIGDAVVAVFGAPLDDPNHAANAVHAALEAREQLAKMNAEGAFNGRTIVTRTGINTGEALVGNVGSSRRFNYTVMGDTVNTASRLEGANKAMGTTILIAEETAAALPERFVLRVIDLIRVKGRNAPVQVFEPLATEGIGDMESARRLSLLFAGAHGLFLARRFTEAAELLTTEPRDPAANKFRARAEALAHNPPGEEWDGVNTLQEK